MIDAASDASARVPVAAPRATGSSALPTSQISDPKGANWLGVRDGIRNYLVMAA
jgi:hypothetical protein